MISTRLADGTGGPEVNEMTEQKPNPPEPGGKIFVVSLHRVVTRSTDMLLSMLGYHTVHYPKFHGGRNLHDAVKGMEQDPDRVVETMAPVIDQFDAVSDVPFPTLYRQLNERWPGSRFILAYRDPDGWVAGVRTMLRDRKLSPFVRIQYAPYIGPNHDTILDVEDADLYSMYFEHLDQVHRYFHEELGEPEKLCTICVRDPEPGETICRFLGHEPLSLPRISGKDPAGELETARTWVARCPKNADAHYLLGKTLCALGQNDDASAALERSLRLGPDNAKAHLLLQRLAARSGDRTKAWRHAAAAIDLGMRNKANLYFKAALGALRHGQLTRGVSLLFHGIHRSLVPYK